MEWRQRRFAMFSNRRRKNVCAILLACSLIAVPVNAMALSQDERYLANSVTGPIGEEGVSGQQLTASSTRTGLVPIERSLWESLLLEFAIERDPEMYKLMRKETNVKTYALWNVAILNGFSAGQSIPFLAAPNATLFARQVLGVVTSGLALMGTGIQAWLTRNYRRQEKRSIENLRTKIHDVVERLRSGENPEIVRLELDELVGAQASQEFIRIWQAAYPPGTPPDVVPPETLPKETRPEDKREQSYPTEESSGSIESPL